MRGRLGRLGESASVRGWTAGSLLPHPPFGNFSNLKLGCIGIRFGEPIPYRIALTRESRALAGGGFPWDWGDGERR